jgi:hypothetical protein
LKDYSQDSMLDLLVTESRHMRYDNALYLALSVRGQFAASGHFNLPALNRMRFPTWNLGYETPPTGNGTQVAHKCGQDGRFIGVWRGCY